MFLIIVFAVAAAFTLVAAFFDLRFRKIPNLLTVPAAIAGVVFHTAVWAWRDESSWVSGAFHGAAFSLGGLALGFGVLLVLWLVGGAGGGDVKLMGALGAWLGWKFTLYVLFGSAGAMLVMGFIALTYKSINKGMYRVKEQHFGGRDQALGSTRRKRLIPYGIPVALATCGLLIYVVCVSTGLK